MIGQEITWFDSTANRLEKAVIEKFTTTRCDVKNISDAKRWRVQYAAINIDNIDTSIHSSQKFGLKKSALSVGDIVSFLDKEHKLQFAKVQKLNPKTAGVITMEGTITYPPLYTFHRNNTSCFRVKFLNFCEL